MTKAERARIAAMLRFTQSLFLLLVASADALAATPNAYTDSLNLSGFRQVSDRAWVLP